MADLKTVVEQNKPLRAVGVRQENISRIAVYVTVICEDDDGDRFEFDASRFNFDMKHVGKTNKDS